jgi:diguanylate cyclase (GGDEF)-like protein
MQRKSRRFRRWQFSVGVIAPAALLLVLTAVAVAAFVLWSTTGIDARALQRENRLVARAVERQIAEIPTAQESVAIWDDAILYAKLTFDKEWLDNNLGVWMYDFYGFDGAAVLDEADQPIYTMAAGISPSPNFFADNRSVLAPLVADTRSKLAAGALAAYDHGGPYPQARDIVSVGGTPAIVSVMPITSQTGTIPQEPGSEYLHIAVDYLDAAFARKLEHDYSINAASVTMAPTTDSDLVSYPLFNNAGRVVAFVDWRPGRPGVELLKQTGPALAIAFLIAGIIVLALVHRLWRSTSALEAERISARHDAMHDPLTGLANRAHFDAQLSRDLGDRRGTPPVALLILDLDRFKQVNDTLGHTVGDDLICAVGQRLQELIGPADVLARLGGDEFAIIHPCREGPSAALSLANGIVDAIAKPFVVSGGEAFVGASIGLALSSAEDNDPRELTRKADIALYEAKARGRGRVVLYEDSMSAQLQDRHTIEAELREALKRPGQLSVAYQPLYTGRDSEIAGAEALLRWTHPRLGQISPARFIPIAEGAGLIEPLGEFVLREACTFGARWPGHRMAVNISPAQLRNPRFPERVFDLLVETAMRPSDLELEITEGILLDNEGPVRDALSTFRKAGIRIALDDFGTGYSSLSYLKRYPVDCIKIDRSFVAQIAPSGSSTAIVQAMVTLAHALDIEVTAEGVETHEQMNVLRAMGCNLVQGFLLSPPAPEDVVEAKFRRAGERRRGEVAQVA